MKAAWPNHPVPEPDLVMAGSFDGGPPSLDPPAGSTMGPSTPGTSEDNMCPVMEAWKALPGLMERAANSARITFMSPNGISRQCVIDNADIIEPLTNNIGARVATICEATCLCSCPPFLHVMPDDDCN